MSLGATVTALVTHWGLPLVVVLALAEGDSLAMIAGAMPRIISSVSRTRPVTGPSASPDPQAQGSAR